MLIQGCSISLLTKLASQDMKSVYNGRRIKQGSEEIKGQRILVCSFFLFYANKVNFVFRKILIKTIKNKKKNFFYYARYFSKFAP